MKSTLKAKNSLAVAILCMALCGSAWAVDANDPNLIAHWKLDEGSGTTASDSAGDNDGNLINGPLWTTGIIDGALEFDGVDDYVDVNPVGELDFERTEAYTLSAWYKGDAENHAILSKMGQSISYRGYDMYIFSGYVRAHIINNWPSNAICETGTLYPISDFIWHHIVVTYDGSSSANGLKIYVDGMEETTTVYVDSLSSTIQNSVSFKMAARGGTSTSAHLGGKIDDVRVYNRALSAQEIQMSMHVPLEGNEPNLVGYWDFDEGEGQVAYDMSGNGNNGQLGSAPIADNSDPNWVDSDAPVGICPIEIAVDIKPGSCPNPLNVNSKGVIPVAILGSQDFDVNSIDPVSIQLAGVGAIRSSCEDVAAPVIDGQECECTTEGPDGYLDLTLKFKTQEIVQALGEVVNGEVLFLTLTGELFDETPIEGEDCVVIRKKGKPK